MHGEVCQPVWDGGEVQEGTSPVQDEVHYGVGSENGDFCVQLACHVGGDGERAEEGGGDGD